MNEELKQKQIQELIEALNSPFPADKIHEAFPRYALLVFEGYTPKSLNCNYDVFRKIFTYPKELSISEMGIALNAITQTSFKDFPFGIFVGTKLTDVPPDNRKRYIQIMDWAFQMVKDWNEIVQVTEQRITSKYTNMSKLLA